MKMNEEKQDTINIVPYIIIQPNPFYDVILCMEASITSVPSAILDTETNYFTAEIPKTFKLTPMKPNPLCYKPGVWGGQGKILLNSYFKALSLTEIFIAKPLKLKNNTLKQPYKFQ